MSSELNEGQKMDQRRADAVVSAVAFRAQSKWDPEWEIVVRATLNVLHTHEWFAFVTPFGEAATVTERTDSDAGN